MAMVFGYKVARMEEEKKETAFKSRSVLQRCDDHLVILSTTQSQPLALSRSPFCDFRPYLVQIFFVLHIPDVILLRKLRSHLSVLSNESAKSLSIKISTLRQNISGEAVVAGLQEIFNLPAK
jgi:hypothetical protein